MSYDYLEQLKEQQKKHSKTAQLCALLFVLVGLPILSLPHDNEVKYVMFFPITVVLVWGAIAWYQFSKVSTKVSREEWHNKSARMRDYKQSD